MNKHPERKLSRESEQLIDRESFARLSREWLAVPVENQPEVRRAEEEISAEIFTTEAGVERIKNSLAKIDLYERLGRGETLADRERESLAAELRDRGWNKILNNLAAGDRVAFFTSPGGEFGIKNMNDVYFGPQTTDDILAWRNQTLEKLMSQIGATALLSDYKNGIFKLADNNLDDLNKVGRELDQAMRKFVAGEIKKKIKEIKNDENFSPKERAGRLAGLKSFDDKLKKFGFVVSYGVSTVAGAAGGEDKSPAALAVARAAEVSHLSRRETPEVYGHEYSEELIADELAAIYGPGGLAEQIDSSWPVLRDGSGEEYPVFSRQDSKYVLNRDLARLARKGKFVPATETDNVGLAKVTEYMRRVNLIDLVKPLTAEETTGRANLLNGENLSANLARTEFLSAKLLLNDLNEDEARETADRLKTDVKDSRFTSADVFHREALRKNDCVYVSLDVLDLGLDALASYESLAQDLLVADSDAAEEIILRAGDEATEKMRQTRGLARELYKKYFNEEPVALVGGDELTIAMNERAGIEDFMLELQAMTNSRVVKTAIAMAERHSATELDWRDDTAVTARAREHLAAQKRVESGVDLAKRIEAARRQAEKEMAAKNISYEKIGAALTAAGLGNFIVRERYDGGFEAVARADNRKQVITGAEALDILDNLSSRFASSA